MSTKWESGFGHFSAFLNFGPFFGPFLGTVVGNSNPIELEGPGMVSS